MRIAVIGAGAFGTALANLLSLKGHDVQLWARESELVPLINAAHENAMYLPGIALAPTLTAFDSLGEASEGAELVLLAVPSHGLRAIAAQLEPSLPPRIPIVTVAKGIENETLFTMSEVLEDVLPVDRHPYIAIVSGPSFAREVAEGQPTSVTVAARWDRIARLVQTAFSNEVLRVYTSIDLIGVQYGGALKNVMAIAVGAAQGLGFGFNGQAALITRGLAEITRAAVQHGANPMTLSGLSGMGDLVLTCTGTLSRNRELGMALGQGRTLEELQKNRLTVAEGVCTAKSARQIAERDGIDMPISCAVHRVLFEGQSPRAALGDLLSRPLKAEF
ncbi:MAG: NAD(P)-dependent glycerol-3-phosphate dehydrogenase [Myxococcales bacterium]|jgi:glycerol-3-phosphate dehydrogenase (NAD(P)+)|nr:NAD(P)-dependent glycerol-3-phosphate dehydrogenase [Myxococcales bacterium]